MKLLFAPLDGITGFTYRNLHHALFDGVNAHYAPFISPTVNEEMRGKEIRDILPENNKGINLVPQILANRSDFFIRGAEQLIDMGYTDEININIGCPSGTVTSKNKGSGFLRDLDGMNRFLDEVYTWNDNLENPLALTVKTRIGYETAYEFQDILDVYNKYPIPLLIVHPRTKKQMYKERANLDAFQYAYDNSKNALCYNGDINTLEDYEYIKKRFSKIEYAMIGRGMITNPNLANEINGEEKLTLDQIKKYHDTFYDEFEKIFESDKHLLFKMKEFWNYVSKNFVKENEICKMIRKCQSLDKYKAYAQIIVESYDLKEYNKQGLNVVNND